MSSEKNQLLNKFNTYFSPIGVVEQMIANRYKNLSLESANIEEWSAECVIEYIGDAPQWLNFKKIKLPIANKQALLPCNVHRLLDVFDEYGHVINYDSNGTYIYPEEGYTRDYLYINYYGLPVTVDGNIMIPKGHERACMYYCLKTYYEPGYMDGTIPENRMRFLQEELGEAVEDAKASNINFSRNHALLISQIMNNMVVDLINSPKYNLDR